MTREERIEAVIKMKTYGALGSDVGASSNPETEKYYQAFIEGEINETELENLLNEFYNLKKHD